MIVVQTPLRVSLAGGGTDIPSYYHSASGYVVNAAIDKYTFVILTPRYDDRIYISYSRKEIVDRVDEISHELVRESMRLTGVERGIELTLLSDIPSEGSGLGSSSSFTVGLLHALHVYKGEPVTPAALAAEACTVEIARCGRRIGKQDQYIAAFGGIVGLTFHPDERVSIERIELSANQRRRFDSELFLFYSQQTRHAAAILEQQHARAGENRAYLDAIRRIAVDTRACLHAGGFRELGGLLDESWRLKKQLSTGVSNPTLERMHALARGAGATGAKVCGAGGGGFLLVHCVPRFQDRLLDALAEFRDMPFALEPEGSKVIFNYRRSVWKAVPAAPQERRRA